MTDLKAAAVSAAVRGNILTADEANRPDAFEILAEIIRREED